MKTVLACLAIAILLSGCLPMAMFANGNGPAYRNLRTSYGTYISHNEVDAGCLTPKLRLAIWEFEGFFGGKVIMNSGYRTPQHNASVGGAENSFHMRCMAADFYIPGIDKSKLIAFAMRLGYVGGLGCYPGRDFIHIDVRDRARGANGPITFSGC
jgi:zinc D-Ala-D-Ala carboxypeptidase